MKRPRSLRRPSRFRPPRRIALTTGKPLKRNNRAHPRKRRWGDGGPGGIDFFSVSLNRLRQLDGKIVVAGGELIGRYTSDGLINPRHELHIPTHHTPQFYKITPLDEIKAFTSELKNSLPQLPPRHLKLPTRPGEHAADALYNAVRDFCD